MNAGRASKVVCFADFRLDLWACELSRNGSRIKVPQQSIQLLELLVGLAGEVVTREQLQKKLWPNNTIVEFEHSINTAMNRLRQALGDSAETPRFIETLPKRGYRFIMSVETLPNAVPAANFDLEGSPISVVERSEQPEKRPRHWRLALACGTVAAAAAVLLGLNVAGLRNRVEAIVGGRHAAPVRKIESIAVLPLQNLSGDPEQEYLADGMTEALISDLGRIALLRVISRTSAMHYKGTNKRLPEIARELNVDAIFEGSVHRSGNRVRITTQLFQASPEKQIWSQRYERDLRDVLVLQGEVARAVAQEIQVALTPVEQVRLSKAVPVDPEAHELYLKGRYFWNKRSDEAVKKSLDYFEQAIRKDPGSALAYAGLADAYSILGTYEYLPPKEAYPKAKAAALRALGIDATLAEAHSCLALIKMEYEWDAPGSEQEYKRAIQLNPNYATAHQWYGQYLTMDGRHDESLVEIRRARQLDPLSLIINNAVAVSLYYARRYEEAIRQYQNTLDIDPNFLITRYYLAVAYARTSRFPEAIAEAQKAVRLSGGDAFFVTGLARVYAVAGNRAAAHKLLKDLSSRLYVPKYHVALAHIALGEHEQAFAWLAKAVEDRSPQLIFFRVDIEVDPLRSDPRFGDLLRRMNRRP